MVVLYNPKYFIVYFQQATPSAVTGPSFAAEGLFFSYLETSSTNEGQKAIYKSNVDLQGIFFSLIK